MLRSPPTIYVVHTTRRYDYFQIHRVALAVVVLMLFGSTRAHAGVDDRAIIDRDNFMLSSSVPLRDTELVHLYAEESVCSNEGAVGAP